MILSKKVPSFTLIELLIVLAISVIVIGLAFTVINLFSRNIQIIQTNYHTNTKESLLEQRLNVDFNRFHIIKFNSVSNKMVLNTPLDSIVYMFEDDLIIRNSDTLWMNPYYLRKYYKGNEITKGLLDALKIKINNEEVLFFFKNGSAFQEMNEYGN